MTPSMWMMCLSGTADGCGKGVSPVPFSGRSRVARPPSAGGRDVGGAARVVEAGNGRAEGVHSSLEFRASRPGHAPLPCDPSTPPALVMLPELLFWNSPPRGGARSHEAPARAPRERPARSLAPRMAPTTAAAGVARPTPMSDGSVAARPRSSSIWTRRLGSCSHGRTTRCRAPNIGVDER